MKSLRANQLWIYSFLAFPLAFAELPLFINIPKFYNEVMGLTLSHIGLILLLVRTFDALKDPLLGYWGDRTYTDRRSRYRFMLGFIPLFVLAFVALWNPPEMGYLATLLWFVICLLCVHLADGAIIISYYALGAEISKNYNTRTRITSLRESLRILGLLVAAALPSVLASFYGLSFAFSCFSLLFGVCLVGFFLLAYFRGPRGRRPCEQTAYRPRDYLKTFKNRNFVTLVLIHSLNVFAFAIPTVLFAFFVRDAVGAPHFEGLFLIVYFLSAVAGMSVWSKLAERTSKKTSWTIALVVGAMALLAAVLSKSGSVAPFFAVCFLFGLTFGADLALPPSMLADIIDEDSGSQTVTTGSYFGVWNVTAKLSTALAPGLAFPFLEYYGYGQETPSSSSFGVLVVIFAVVPCFLKLFSAAILWISPLDTEKDALDWEIAAKTV